MGKSICSSGGRLVRIFQSPENATDSAEKGHRSPSTLYDLLTRRAVNGSSGKTCRAYSVPVVEEISRPFYPCFPEARLKSPAEDLPPLDLFAMLDATDTVWHGACWTHSLPEYPDFLSPYPNGGGVCSLSDILETGPVPPKYYLSRTACNGILRRAERRGRELPDALRETLEAQAEKSSSTPSSAEKECR